MVVLLASRARNWLSRAAIRRRLERVLGATLVCLGWCPTQQEGEGWAGGRSTGRVLRPRPPCPTSSGRGSPARAVRSDSPRPGAGEGWAGGRSAGRVLRPGLLLPRSSGRGWPACSARHPAQGRAGSKRPSVGAARSWPVSRRLRPRSFAHLDARHLSKRSARGKTGRSPQSLTVRAQDTSQARCSWSQTLKATLPCSFTCASRALSSRTAAAACSTKTRAPPSSTT